MAGLGRKVFSPGEVLTATNVQNFLMDQAVQVYAGTASRGSAIGSATTEGMVSWLSDTDQMQVATGTATWANVSFAQSPNAIINGAFDIWQRGTSFTVGAASPYTADRWQVNRAGVVAGMTVSRQSASLTGIQYCGRFQRDSGNTSTAALLVWQSIETSMSYPFAGQNVTLSFYARKGANYSATSSALSVNLYSGTGTDQNLNIGGFTGSTVIGSTTATLTTSWQRFSFVAPVSSSATQLGLLYLGTPVGTAGAADYFEITGVQLELGSVATPFRRNANSIQGELSACQRYFIASPTTNITYGMSGNVTAAAGYVAYATFPVPMRTAPSTVTLTNGSIISAFPSTPSSSQGITAFGFYEVRVANATTNGYFGGNYTANAEL
jgi:hypothetical protein